MLDRDKLPDDSTELKGIVYNLLDVLEEQKRLIANQNERIDSQFQKIEDQSKRLDEQAKKIDHLTDQVNSLKRHQYGKKSEKLPDEDPPKENGSGGSSDQLSSSPDGYKRIPSLLYVLDISF